VTARNPPRISTVTARRQLTTRDAPYWTELERGRRLGYVKRSDGAGTWVMREFRAGVAGRRGGYLRRRLGLADDIEPADGARVLSYADARRLADGSNRPTVTNPGRLTVAEAANDYFATRQGAVEQDRLTYVAFIQAERDGIPDLGDRSVSELTTGDLEKWMAAHVPRTDNKDERRKAQATANRRWNLLRAILNSAFRKDPARVPSDGAWRRVRSFANADRPRTRTLTAAEAKRLLAALEEPMRDLARGALLTGLRYGELQALTAADVGDDFVRVRESKSGRPRTVPLSEAGARLFTALAEGKVPGAAVFARISRVNVSRAMRPACVVAKIDPPAVFHDLRRSYGSLLLNAGAAADHIQELLGHADLRMTRRAYAHMTGKTLEKAVKKLPSFE
jgi:integrase